MIARLVSDPYVHDGFTQSIAIAAWRVKPSTLIDLLGLHSYYVRVFGTLYRWKK